jgi:hypothetical protein
MMAHSNSKKTLEKHKYGSREPLSKDYNQVGQPNIVQ